MIKVIRWTDNEYVVTRGEKEAYYGDVARTIEVLELMRVDYRCAEDALVSLIVNDHNVAHFGVNRHFILTERLSNYDKKVA
jgi:hypothetical protein